MPNNWLQLAQEALKIPGLLVEVYGDLAKPGVKQVGKALDTVIGFGNTILWPIAWANERSRVALEQNLQKYRQKLESTPEEKIVNVAPEIGVPIAEKLAYVTDKRLSDLYVELLTKASKAETVSQAHPSFVNIIDNLSPDEAEMIEYFADGDDLPIVTAKWSIPKSNAYSFAGELLVDEEIFSNLLFPENVPAYISNLSGLGIVSIHPNRFIHKSPVYERLEEYWRTQLLSQFDTDPERTLNFERGVVSITTFGEQFISACHDEDGES